jgi:hypothetical protein
MLQQRVQQNRFMLHLMLRGKSLILPKSVRQRASPQADIFPPHKALRAAGKKAGAGLLFL